MKQFEEVDLSMVVMPALIKTTHNMLLQQHTKGLNLYPI